MSYRSIADDRLHAEVPSREYQMIDTWSAPFLIMINEMYQSLRINMLITVSKQNKYRRVQITDMLWDNFQWTLVFYVKTRNSNQLFVKSKPLYV